MDCASAYVEAYGRDTEFEGASPRAQCRLVCVQALDGAGRRDTHSRDEDLCAVADGDFDELVELAVRVVMVGLAGAAADLGQGEVDAECAVLVVEVLFKLIDDLGKMSVFGPNAWM